MPTVGSRLRCGLSKSQLKATATIPGSFAYAPSNGAVLPPGSNQLLTHTFMLFDRGQWSVVTVTQYVTVTATNPVNLPILAITSPIAGTQFTNGASIPVTVNVVSNGWVISSVQLHDNSTLVQSVSNSPYNLSLSNAVGACLPQRNQLRDELLLSPTMWRGRLFN